MMNGWGGFGQRQAVTLERTDSMIHQSDNLKFIP
jgi:hypothetical protein